MPIFAFSATQESDGGFNILFRFVITPLFLFSGTFFPIEQLPAVLRPVAWLTPLWHGVDANRELGPGLTGPRAGGPARAGPAGVRRRRWLAGAARLPREAGRMTTRTRLPAAPPATRVSRLARLLPVPAGAGMARILVERNVMAFRHGWIAFITGFAEPVFYLFSLGIGLGALVADGDDRRRVPSCPTRRSSRRRCWRPRR